MRKYIFAVLTTLVFALSACGATSGDVYAKDVIPEHTKYVSVSDYAYTCTPVTRTRYVNNQPQTYVDMDCGNHWVGSHQEQRIVPTCYKVMFKNTDGDKGDDCIGKSRYDTIDIGDFYDKG